jgi:hypothetical protein
MIYIEMFFQYNYIMSCVIYDFFFLLVFLDLNSNLDSYNKKYNAWLEQVLNQLVYY